MQLLDPHSEQLTTQSYQAKPTIEGVEIVTREQFNDDGGAFSEIIRLDNNQNVEGLSEPFKVKQVSVSMMTIGVIKAYHVHFRQDDLWFVPPANRLLVNLHDVRKDSPTANAHMRFVVGCGKNTIVRIPKGVAHGVSNPYHKSMYLMYATSEQFDPKDPDEHRLPWDAFGSEVWELTKG